jgi:hypothetical protein
VAGSSAADAEVVGSSAARAEAEVAVAEAEVVGSSASVPTRPGSPVVLDAVGVGVIESPALDETDDGELGPEAVAVAATPKITGTMATPAARVIIRGRFMMTPWKWCASFITSSLSPEELATIRQWV